MPVPLAEVSLSRRLDTRHYAIREASAVEAGPVLQRYVGVATAAREYFRADKDAPVEQFVAEASRHPVIRAHSDRVGRRLDRRDGLSDRACRPPTRSTVRPIVLGESSTGDEDRRRHRRA